MTMFRERDTSLFIGPVRVGASSIDATGNGCFATTDISKGDIIERGAVLLFAKETLIVLEKYADARHVLSDYAFNWRDNQAAVGWGYTSLYNHSNEANAAFRCVYDIPAIEIVAKCDINAGEEICITYYKGARVDVEFTPSGDSFVNLPMGMAEGDALSAPLSLKATIKLV